MKQRLLILCVIVQMLSVANTQTSSEPTESYTLTESITELVTNPDNVGTSETSSRPDVTSPNESNDIVTTTNPANANPTTESSDTSTESNALLTTTNAPPNEPLTTELPGSLTSSESPNQPGTASESPNEPLTTESPGSTSSESPNQPGTASESPDESLTTESVTELQSQPDSNSTDNSTQPIEVTTTTTTTKTLPPTTTPPPVNAPAPVAPDFGNADVDIPGEVTYNWTFNENYENPESKEYKELEAQTIAKVDVYFQNIPEYVKTIVNNFRNGSIIANITVVMKGVLNSDNGNYSICADIPVEPDMKLFNGEDCNDYLASQVSVVCDTSSTQICPVAWQCVYDTMTSEASCQSPCYIAMSQDTNFCVSEGQVCRIDTDGTTVEAICTCDPHYLNVGDSCLNQNVIIIIASVCGGLLILSLLGVITVMVCRLNKSKSSYPAYVSSKESKRAQDLWASVPGDNASLHPYADVISEQENIPNQKAAEPKSTERNSLQNSDSGRETPGVDNHAYEHDEPKYEGRNWENIELDEPRYTRNVPTTDLDKASTVSERDDTYMRSLISSQAYRDLGDSDFHFKRPALRMSNMTNMQSERSDGEEYIF